MNPDPKRYRSADVCRDGTQVYPGLLARARFPLGLLGAWLRAGLARDATRPGLQSAARQRNISWSPRRLRYRLWRRLAFNRTVNPLLTRSVLDQVVGDLPEDMWAVWEGETLIIGDRESDLPPRHLTPNESGLFRVGGFDRVGVWDWSWYEFLPAWPSDPIDPVTIVSLLVTSPRPQLIVDRLSAHVTASDLAAALLATDNAAIQSDICRALRGRGEGDYVLDTKGHDDLPQALPALLQLLEEPEPRRTLSQRVDLIEAIKSIAWGAGAKAVKQSCPDAGERVLEQLRHEPDAWVKEELACTLGQLQHHEAIPDLIELLRRRDTWREAECALGNLAATEAVQRAIDAETDTELAGKMERSLQRIVAATPPDTRGENHALRT